MVDIKDSLSLSSKIDELVEFIGEENIGEDVLANFKLRSPSVFGCTCPFMT